MSDLVVVLIIVLLALVLLRVCLRAAPLPTLLGIALIGFALQTGVISLPSAITRPVAHLSSDIRAWQHRQSIRLQCEAAQASAVRAGTEAALDRAAEACNSQ